MGVQNLRYRSLKRGPKTAEFRVVLRRHRDLNANIFGTKSAMENAKKYLTNKGSPIFFSKFGKLQPTNSWDFVPHFCPPSAVCSFRRVHTAAVKWQRSRVALCLIIIIIIIIIIIMNYNRSVCVWSVDSS